MKALAITLSVVALLVLAAHFLRADNRFFMLLSLALIATLALRRPWVRRVLQVALAFGAVEWLRVAYDRCEMRQLHGEPWVRMAVILGSVAVVTALAALSLESRAMRAHFGEPRTQEPAGEADPAPGG